MSSSDSEKKAKAKLVKAMRDDGWLVDPVEDRFRKSMPDLVASRDYKTAFLEVKVLEWPLIWIGEPKYVRVAGSDEIRLNFAPHFGDAHKGHFRVHQTESLYRRSLKAWKAEFVIWFEGTVIVGQVHPSAVMHSYKHDMPVAVKVMEVPEWLRRLSQ